MRINLLPKELQPVRPSPVPYMPLGGLVAISVVWLIVQFAVAAGAGRVANEHERDLQRVLKDLGPTRGVAAELDHAKAALDALRLKAAAVTVLTQSRSPISPVLFHLPQLVPKELRLTSVSFDPVQGTGALVGYGSEEKADVQVARFVRALNEDKALSEIFAGAELDRCQLAERGGLAVKEFTISLRFRDRLKPRSSTPKPPDGA